MPHSRSVLKEALARAIEDEGQAALQLALAVLERPPAHRRRPEGGPVPASRGPRELLTGGHMGLAKPPATAHISPVDRWTTI